MAFPVAVAQLSLDAEHPADNLAAGRALVNNALKRGASVVLLPESFYSDLYRGAAAHAQPLPGPVSEALAQVAGDGLIAAPILERAEGAVYSSCAFIDKSGVRAVARRTHLYFDPSGADLFRDSDVIRAGNELTIFEFKGARLGVLLGFDAEFPEAFRALARRGADVILVALNCIEPDRTFLSAMAKRNRVPIAVSNRLGFKRIYPSEPEASATKLPIVQDRRGEFLLRCRGHSVIFAPDGTAATGTAPDAALAAPAGAPEGLVIPAGYQQEECVQIASFNLDELRIDRMTHPLLNAWRNDLY